MLVYVNKIFSCYFVYYNPGESNNRVRKQKSINEWDNFFFCSLFYLEWDFFFNVKNPVEVEFHKMTYVSSFHSVNYVRNSPINETKKKKKLVTDHSQVNHHSQFIPLHASDTHTHTHTIWWCFIKSGNIYFFHFKINIHCFYFFFYFVFFSSSLYWLTFRD